MPISTTDVGVAVFSLTLKSSVKMAKLKISSPDPLMPVKSPPTTPVKTNAMDFLFTIGACSFHSEIR